MKDINPEIKEEHVYRLLGYGKRNPLSRQISNKIKRSIKSIHPLLKPKIAYEEKKIKKTEKGTVMLEKNIELKSSRLSRALKKSDRAVVFLATVGKEIDKKINTLMNQKKITDAYIFDAIGSIAVEETVNMFQERFDSIAQINKERSTVRFSPGYCDWPVQEQKKIFRILDSSQIGVELNTSCLMTPRKTVSGVFGIEHTGKVNKGKSNPCRICNMKNCVARRKE